MAATSNHITSVAPPEGIITSVVPDSPPVYDAPQNGANQQLLSRLNLDLRGTLFPVDREQLMLLPESVLLGLFPQGLILSKPASSEGADDGIFTVDFDPQCFQYILDFWATAQTSFYGTPTTPGYFHAQQTMCQSDPALDQQSNPLLSKQAIIVLREELEYFSITKPGAEARTNMMTGLANEELRALRRNCGKALVKKRRIFTALQRNVNKENNQAEQHLIDMLCMSGFERDDEWGFRACEPARNVISSMALVLLKTGIIHPTPPDAPPEQSQAPYIDLDQINTAQKLLLFWRKPARKCWWDGIEVEVPASLKSKGEMIKVKVWARRVWTLELSLVSLYVTMYFFTLRF
ncbi:phosphatase activator [Tremella mesenterica]|uniref:Phosphatase activator n=1 Tax=Tremella mesenterica TaxID=5217 RepID=A0A4Q1BSQ2_TREME|nr:phosphatase activator [Tremella mesenterica]